jgi:hypothetical protein
MKSQQPTKTTKLENYQFTSHAVEQLQNRFGMTTEDVMKVKQYFKKGCVSCKHNVVRKKITNYPNQVAYYNEKFNLLLMCDVRNGDVVNALYLDGKNGYDYLQR